MINSWSLLYDELYGDEEMTEDNTITSLESDEYDPKPKTDSDDADWNDPIITVGTGNTATEPAHSPYYYDWDRNGLTENPFENDEIKLETNSDLFNVPFPSGSVDTDTLNVGYASSEEGADIINFGDSAETLNISIPSEFIIHDDYPSAFSTFADNDDSIAHHITTPAPGIETDNPRKYKEDESIKALQDYISTTYGGHYTSKENNVQTLDLIESVGDAESFCRSNAIKYLSRYDKKGQAKRDILKALHYTLLLYHFSGQLNETTTRGYETF